MSGHNKWSKIKHQKAATDAKKSKVFGKLALLIAAEARIAKGDRNAPNVRTVVEKARKANMPGDNIERALKKASEGGAELESIKYEGYGPGGVGIIIEALTANRNKTAPEVKHALSANGGALGAPNSVSWNFKKENGEWIPQSTVDLTDEDLEKLSTLVDTLENLDDVQEVYTNAE